MVNVTWYVSTGAVQLPCTKALWSSFSVKDLDWRCLFWAFWASTLQLLIHEPCVLVRSSKFKVQKPNHSMDRRLEGALIKHVVAIFCLIFCLELIHLLTLLNRQFLQHQWKGWRKLSANPASSLFVRLAKVCAGRAITSNYAPARPNNTRQGHWDGRRQILNAFVPVASAELQVLAVTNIEDKLCDPLGRYLALIMEKASIQLALELLSRNYGLYLYKRLRRDWEQNQVSCFACWIHRRNYRVTRGRRRCNSRGWFREAQGPAQELFSLLLIFLWQELPGFLPTWPISAHHHS